MLEIRFWDICILYWDMFRVRVERKFTVIRTQCSCNNSEYIRRGKWACYSDKSNLTEKWRNQGTIFPSIDDPCVNYSAALGRNSFVIRM